MSHRGSIRRLAFALGLWATCHAGPALAGIHTWDVNEVFSNADGTIQFVELWEAAGGAGEVNVGNGSISSDTQTFAFGQGAVTGPTSNKFYLLATQGFADLAGAPTPDAIIPSGSVPFFSPAGDTVDFGVYDSWNFASAPTNGTDSLDRLTGVGANTPTNYAGETGSVDASPPPPPPPPTPVLPALSRGTLLILMALLGSAGMLIGLRRHRTR